MSLKKPIIKVTKECSKCFGSGGKYPYVTVKCPRCKGIGKLDIRKNNKDFKEYYIKNLEEVIEYYTGSYRQKNEEAQEYLKKLNKYSKELDKVVNK